MAHTSLNAYYWNYLSEEFNSSAKHGERQAAQIHARTSSKEILKSSQLHNDDRFWKLLMCWLLRATKWKLYQQGASLYQAFQGCLEGQAISLPQRLCQSGEQVRGMFLTEVHKDTSMWPKGKHPPMGGLHRAGHNQLCSRSPVRSYGNVLGRSENWNC